MRIGVSRRKFVVVEISLNPRLIELLTLESALVTFQVYRVSVWMSWLDLESAVNRGWKFPISAQTQWHNVHTSHYYIRLIDAPIGYSGYLLWSLSALDSGSGRLGIVGGSIGLLRRIELLVIFPLVVWTLDLPTPPCPVVVLNWRGQADQFMGSLSGAHGGICSSLSDTS